MKSKTLVKIAFFCLLAGTGLIAFKDKDITGFSIQEKIVQEPYKNISLYFCETDDCGSIESKLIDESTKADCAFYDIDLENVVNSLSNKPYRLVTDDVSKVKIEHKNEVFLGRGTSTDVIEASVKAYLSAINRILRKKEKK